MFALHIGASDASTAGKQAPDRQALLQSCAAEGLALAQLQLNSFVAKLTEEPLRLSQGISSPQALPFSQTQILVETSLK